MNSRFRAVTVLTPLCVAPFEPKDGGACGTPDARPNYGGLRMTALGIAATVTLGVLGLLVGYTIVAYLVLFYLLGDGRLRYGLAVDAAYAFVLPFVVTITWLRTVRGH